MRYGLGVGREFTTVSKILIRFKALQKIYTEFK